jgi:hypothetical protein
LRGELKFDRVPEAHPMEPPHGSFDDIDASYSAGANETAQRELLQSGGYTAQYGISCWRGYGKMGSAKGVKYEKKWLQYCGPSVTYCYAASVNPFFVFSEENGGYREIMEDFYPEVDWEYNYKFYQAFYILDCGGAWRHDEYKSCPVKPGDLAEYEIQTAEAPVAQFRKVGNGITHIYAPANEQQRRNRHGHPDIDCVDVNCPSRLIYGTPLIPNYCCTADGCYNWNSARGWRDAALYTPLLVGAAHALLGLYFGL